MLPTRDRNAILMKCDHPCSPRSISHQVVDREIRRRNDFVFASEGTRLSFPPRGCAEGACHSEDTRKSWLLDPVCSPFLYMTESCDEAQPFNKIAELSRRQTWMSVASDRAAIVTLARSSCQSRDLPMLSIHFDWHC